MLITASLTVVLVTKTVASEFLSAGPVSGEDDVGAVAELVTDKAEGGEVAGTAFLASWCRAARCLLRSLAAGPRWRGR